MKNIILLIVAILPIYLIGLYVYKKDRDKESKKLLSKLFIFGIFSCFPAVLLELIISSFFPLTQNISLLKMFIYVFISIALIEEICKWFMVYKFTYSNKEFNHAYDAIVYCVFVSLGFAILENILYVFTNGIVVGLVRAVSAIPGHTCDAIVMGEYLALSKIAEVNNNAKMAKKNLLLSIIMPALVHTIYDYCLFTGQLVFLIIFLIILIWIYIYGINKIKKISNIKNNFINDINSNSKIVGKYCSNCGNELLIKEENNIKEKYCSVCGNNILSNTNKFDNNLTQ